jgi:serine/threonine-protein kinase
MKLAHGAEIAPGLRLVQPIGKGSMGSIWKADWDQREGIVAVKLIPERVARVKGMLERFRREAEVARRIQSHHVVEIYDLGETVDGLPYILMEYLEGETLEARLEREGVASRSFAVRFVPQLGAALQAAHDVNVMHRDIKPSNLFLIGQGDSPMLKVLDFGAAKEVRVKGGSIVTATGVAIGSPFMMSPEQVLGSRYVDHRTDLWSFGVVLYRMLTGDLPFVADNPSALAFTICQAKYRKPSELGAPPELDLWFARALQPKKERRFGSAREMADAFLEMVGARVSSPVVDDESSFDTATTGIFEGAATFAATHVPDPTGDDDSVTLTDDDSVTLTDDDDLGRVDTRKRNSAEVVAEVSSEELEEAEPRRAQETLPGPPPPPARTKRKEQPPVEEDEAAPDEEPEPSPSAPDDEAATPADSGESVPEFPAPSVPPPPSDPEAAAPESSRSVSPAAVSSQSVDKSPTSRKGSLPYAWIGVGALVAAAVAIFAVRQTNTESSSPAAAPKDAAPTTLAETEPTATATTEAPAAEPSPAPEPEAEPSPSASASASPSEDGGHLTVICVPKCSDVKVDGESWGPSPIEKHAITTGFHSLMLFRAGLGAKPMSIRIDEGEHEEKKVYFDTKPATAPQPALPSSSAPSPAASPSVSPSAPGPKPPPPAAPSPPPPPPPPAPAPPTDPAPTPAPPPPPAPEAPAP